MGLYDRHYYRDRTVRPTSSGLSGLGAIRMLSVNTWLIVICVGVFVIDGFLPQRDVWTGRVEPENLLSVPEIWVIQARQPNEQIPRNVQRYARPVIEKSTGKQKGVAEVYNLNYLASFLHFSTRLGFLKIEYWRFIGFQFLHANEVHILFNMLGLFFFGPMVEQYLGSKRFLAFYLLCGISGAIVFLLLNLGGLVVQMRMHQPIAIPGLLFDDISTPLMGASAGVFGILMAGAFLAPRAKVLLFFIIPMQLRTLAYVLVALALYSVITGGHNAGGEAGHLGGAIAGYYFIRRPHHLHGFFDFLGRADPTSHHYRHKRGSTARGSSASGSTADVDRILDKINREGIHSLTDDEKRVLREASGGGR